MEIQQANRLNCLNKNKEAITIIKNWKILSLILVLIYLGGCSIENKKYNFDQIGYYKSENNLRVFTFYINTQEQLSKDSIPEELWTLINEHGRNRMHTQGVQTQSFYFLDKKKAPDVTMYPSFDKALNKAYDNKPLAVVYIDNYGKKGLIQNPD